MASDITSRSAFYDELEPDWKMIEALKSTRSMRAARALYLPQSKNELDEMYQNRLNRATLAPFFKKTVNNFAGRIFSKPVMLEEDVPPKLIEWSENIDRQGNNMTVFFKNAAAQAIRKGSAWAMVDYPRVDGAETLADERALGARPYLTFYPAESVFYARIDEQGKLSEVRMFETITIPDGEFAEQQIQQIRRIFKNESNTVTYQIWRDDESKKDSDWVVVAEGIMSIDEIPVVPIFTNPQDDPLFSPPPLIDLAYLCVKHWQAQSEQDNVAEVARYPMLAVNGWDKDKDTDIAIGPRFMLATNEPAGKFYYVEHSGAAIASGRAELERLEDQIAMEGTRPMTRNRTANGATATQIESEDSTTKSEIELWKESIKDAIEKCLLLMAKWVGMGEDAGGSVALTGDFDFATADASTLSMLQQMRTRGDLSQMTLWSEMKRRGILGDSFEPEDEQDRLSSEGPTMEEMSMMDSTKSKQSKEE